MQLSSDFQCSTPLHEVISNVGKYLTQTGVQTFSFHQNTQLHSPKSLKAFYSFLISHSLDFVKVQLPRQALDQSLPDPPHKKVTAEKFLDCTGGPTFYFGTSNLTLAHYLLVAHRPACFACPSDAQKFATANIMSSVRKSGKEKRASPPPMRYPFWFGGSASCFAACVTHPLDLGTPPLSPLHSIQS